MVSEALVLCKSTLGLDALYADGHACLFTANQLLSKRTLSYDAELLSSAYHGIGCCRSGSRLLDGKQKIFNFVKVVIAAILRKP